MRLFDIFKGNPKKTKSRAKLVYIGQVNAICPYCETNLDKKPGRKKKCPNCEYYIYVRTRPIDREKILIRKDQIEILNEQWSIANGTHDEYLAEKRQYEDEKEKLREKFGGEPSESDVQWSLLNKDILKYSQSQEWGLYRNTKFHMAKNLQERSNDRAALEMMCEVCYIDINGPTNQGITKDPVLRRMYPQWDPKLSLFSKSSIPYLTYKLAKSQDINLEELYQIFECTAEKVKNILKTPVSISKALSEYKTAMRSEKEK